MYRTIVTDFWNDIVVEELSPCGKLLMLYLLTSPVGNIAGCYEVSMKRITRDTGMTANEAKKALAELLDSQRVCYSDATNEVLIVNWPKHNWSTSDKTMKAVAKAISAVKDESFRKHLEQAYNACSEGCMMPLASPFDTPSKPHTRGSITVSVSVPDTEQGDRGAGKGEQKHRLGEFGNVLLTDAELEKLKAKFPDDWKSRIDDLSYYIGSTGKSYTSHYRTILSWERKNSKPTTVRRGVKADAKYAKYH